MQIRGKTGVLEKTEDDRNLKKKNGGGIKMSNPIMP